MNFFKSLLKNSMFLASIAAFCGGAVPVSAKVALHAFPPFTLIGIRFLFATLFLLPFVYYRKEITTQLFSKLWKVAFIGSLNPIIFFIALPYTGASVSPLIYASVPALTAIYLYAIERKSISKNQLLGIILGFSGVALIILLPILQNTTNFAAFTGNFIIFIAAIAFMFYGIESKKKQTAIQASPIAMTFYFCLVTFLVSIPFMIYEISTIEIVTKVEIVHVLNGIFMGIIGTGLFYLAYQYALKAGSEVTAALFTFLQPIATISLAFLFLQEKVTLLFFIGGILALLGARLAVKK